MENTTSMEQNQELNLELNQEHYPETQNPIETNSVDEEQYLQELQRRLNQMKQERKAAEQDTKVLDNRISMLRFEEEKTWKKIENSKKKAYNKLSNLKHMAEVIKQKEIINEIREQEIEQKRASNIKMKSEMKSKFEMKKREKEKQINEEAKLVKVQKQYNSQLVAYLNSEKLNNNKTKCDSIKCQHSIEQEKKKIIEKDRRQKLKAELEKKLYEEFKLKEEAEEKKNRDEIEEMEILQRLQTKTQIQKNSKDYCVLIYNYYHYYSRG